MSITSVQEMEAMQRISQIVADTLRLMREHAKPGMSAFELDAYGGRLLREAGANSAPKLTYGFPGWTCICVNKEVAHGVPTKKKILREGDLINIDVSAEKGGFWSDNGGSFVLGLDKRNFQPLVEASRRILHEGIAQIRPGMRIAELGRFIETEAKKAGFRVIRNLAGHGIGRSLHEAPKHILNCYDRYNRERFEKNGVVAIETFISTTSDYADDTKDGWTLIGDQGGYVAQHEHTLVVTDDKPIILTADNGIAKG